MNELLPDIETVAKKLYEQMKTDTAMPWSELPEAYKQVYRAEVARVYKAIAALS